ncbi:hypothetical protein CROQUDRAFT_666423 [Cronartium quercuum f. sp. fusiforme G11]|uniref:Uncharacterized protein n=1 Tax=Cronartium quercuum f. sp. fusiforme G11 TaxID=708437 RepID=A0A9P6N5V4_9BASI|nr:hypothetical protein CROQUDRAFT_666423 [Cronartium quercuum f. sp. fusiforme G11]
MFLDHFGAPHHYTCLHPLAPPHAQPLPHCLHSYTMLGIPLNSFVHSHYLTLFLTQLVIHTYTSDHTFPYSTHLPHTSEFISPPFFFILLF